MPFSSYASIGEVAQEYQITLRDVDFIVLQKREPSELLLQQLGFVKEFSAFNINEWAVCEDLVKPILQDVWQSYTQDLMLWSHIPLHVDEKLCGTPDYLVARKSPLGRWVLDLPYLVVVEAKRDDFIHGWAQCLAAMLAVRQLNGVPELNLHGITTNGVLWEFGKLEGNTFTKDTRSIALQQLNDLCCALGYVFEQGRAQLLRLPRSA
jgi:hypothetical protein